MEEGEDAETILLLKFLKNSYKFVYFFLFHKLIYIFEILIILLHNLNEIYILQVHYFFFKSLMSPISFDEISNME